MRRFASQSLSNGRFDSNCLTPGTLFMLNVCRSIKNWLSSEREIFPGYLVFSSHLKHGEGEHKMFYYLKKLYN